jgi:CMP/dCMP kinase
MSQSRRRPPVIVAIDGPAGAGKSTLARGLARALGIAYVNTGLMYRALARAAVDGGIDPDDETTLERAARAIAFDLDGGDPPSLHIDGKPPAEGLQSPDVEGVVSKVSRHPRVRTVLREEQRRLGSRGAVMEGRDIATVVFPETDAKIFVTASREAREARRGRERGAAADVGARDTLDARTNPLEPSPGAVVIDATRLSIPQVLTRGLEIVRASRPDLGDEQSAGEVRRV